VFVFVSVEAAAFGWNFYGKYEESGILKQDSVLLLFSLSYLISHTHSLNKH